MVEISFKNCNSGRLKAFTLLEMIIATALFLTAMTMSIGIFIATMNANNKITRIQDVENEARYILEMISKEVRLGTINYDYYKIIYGDTFENPTSILSIVDAADDVSYFALNGDENSSGIIQLSLDGGDNWSNLTTDSIQVQSLDFYLIPETNPYAGDASNIKQPLVLVYLSANYNRDGEMDGKIDIQTAISSRIYKK